MRLAISGTASIGKSTLLKDMLKTWPNYTTPDISYRESIKKLNLPHSKQCTKESQWTILNHIVDTMQKHSDKTHIIYDRCTLDNLVYSMWAFEKQSSDINEAFIEKCIPIVRESLKMLDIIFFIPLTKVAPINIEANGMRETDSVYISEIDNIFKAFKQQYDLAGDSSPYFPKNDTPAIIEIFGNPEQRIALLQQYLNVTGDLHQSTSSVFEDKSFKQISDLLSQQQTALQSEQFEKDIRSGVTKFLKK